MSLAAPPGPALFPAPLQRPGEPMRESRRRAASLSALRFRCSGVNPQQKHPKKKRFPYETAVFSSSIRIASEE
jgi:hypothetical protein